MTNDWWWLLKSKWFETGHFGLEAKDWVSNLGEGTTDGTPQEKPKPPGNLGGGTTDATPEET